MSELTDICRSILLLHHASEELLNQGSSLKKVFYALNVKVKRLLHEQTTSPELISGIITGVKLPKTSVGTFDINMMNWSLFWEQFEVSVPRRKLLRMSRSLTPFFMHWRMNQQGKSFKSFCKWKEIMRKQSNACRSATIDPNSFTRVMFVPFLKLLP